ncbi:unnamed protein product [Soboliphyme baturini]|uniref:guanylate kinase n=1 Tax=Soboliphyme baturini TaxID=241478 RepID=A0A183IKJ9_9BILA|nr:unnamed protein product [Soboliphyme baturini]
MVINVIVISGPSGSGKSTLLKKLFDEHPGTFAFSVSHTTRSPRPGEKDGVDYYFVSREDMEAAIRRGEFLEYAEFGGNLYGTSLMAIKNVQKTNKICILDLELKGVKSVMKTNLQARFVLIKPPSLDVLEQRLRDRGTETTQSLSRRLERAARDIEEASVQQLFDCIIVNDDLQVAYAQLTEFLKQVFAVDCKFTPWLNLYPYLYSLENHLNTCSYLPYFNILCICLLPEDFRNHLTSDSL